ncbi:hypothetical protein GGQ92_002140 [Gracilibacillus halotolerans]|uniref:CAAX prenyl protease 2/Lysostaphin resistance protein A-like domain-containing protein n=1 Tax=Gracilibacillus halotolerans TaxID=74386 RepID=A0A841RNZ7_9BACI|nr:hypothetical protein [Gracilibacillus halotolerans]
MPRRYIYLIITYIAMHFSSLLAIPFIPFLDESQLAYFSIYWQVGAFLVAFIIMLFILKREMKDFFALDNKRVGSLAFWSIIGFILAMITQVVAAFIQTFVLKIQPGSENTFEIMAMARQVPLLIIVITIIGPILEELVFRKAIFGSLYKKMNFFFAGLLSSFIFAIVHMDFSHILVYTAVGFVFAFLYIETKRIIVPIIAHAGMNTFAVVVQLSTDPEEIEEQMRLLEQLQSIIIGGF